MPPAPSAAQPTGPPTCILIRKRRLLCNEAMTDTVDSLYVLPGSRIIEPCRRQEFDQIGCILPHLRQFIGVRQALGGRSTSSPSRTIPGSVSSSWTGTPGSWRPMTMARDILRQNRGLSDRGGFLRALIPEDNRANQKLLRTCGADICAKVSQGQWCSASRAWHASSCSTRSGCETENRQCAHRPRARQRKHGRWHMKHIFASWYPGRWNWYKWCWRWRGLVADPGAEAVLGGAHRLSCHHFQLTPSSGWRATFA